MPLRVIEFDIVVLQNAGCFFGVGFFFSSRRRLTRCLSDWSSDVCSSDLPRDLRERGNVQRLEALDRLEIAELELGHAAARLLLYDRIGDLVVIQHSEQIVAYTRLVVVYIAGRKYRHLPRGAFPVFRLVELARPRPRAEGP